MTYLIRYNKIIAMEDVIYIIYKILDRMMEDV